MVNKSIFIILLFFWNTGLTLAVDTSSLSQEEINKAYNYSYSLEKTQDYTSAIEALSPVLKAYENTYTINYRMGWLSYLNGNLTDATRYYLKALSIYPSSIEVMSQIAKIYYDKLNWLKLEEENQKIIKIDYYNTTANYWYAYALKMQKKYSTAESICRKMLVIYPTSTTFLYELGENLYFLGKYQDSYFIFSSLHTLDPTNKNVLNYLLSFKPIQNKSSTKKKK